MHSLNEPRYATWYYDTSDYILIIQNNSTIMLSTIYDMHISYDFTFCLQFLPLLITCIHCTQW